MEVIVGLGFFMSGEIGLDVKGDASGCLVKLVEWNGGCW